MNRRITDEQRTAILKAYVEGVSGPTIAARYGVGPNYARNLAERAGIVTRPQIEKRFREDRLWQRARVMASA